MAKAEDFACEPGHVLTADEAADYTAYRNAGIAPPDGYADVVMEVQDGKGLVHRCKTSDEKERDEKAHAAALAASKDAAERDERIRSEALARRIASGADEGLATEAINLNPAEQGRAASTRSTVESAKTATGVANDAKTDKKD